MIGHHSHVLAAESHKRAAALSEVNQTGVTLYEATLNIADRLHR